MTAMQDDQIFPADPVDFPATYMRFVRPMFVLRPDRGLANRELLQFCDPLSQVQRYVQQNYRAFSDRLGPLKNGSRLTSFRQIPLSAT